MICKFGSEAVRMRVRNLPSNAFSCGLAILAVAVILSAVIAQGQETPSSLSYTYTSFDYPGAIYTEAMGINTAGVVVGAYTDTNDVTHGFALLPTGKFENLDYPNAISTVLARINDSN